MTVKLNRFARFGRREDGSATIEFVFLFPAFIAIFLMGFESGYFMVRNVMLERAVDISARDIRLGNGKVPQFSALKKNICANTFVFPGCEDSIHVYMTQVAIAPGALAGVTGDVRCINRYSDEEQFGEDDYSVGGTNTMMLMQVCASATPFFPTTGLGLGMQRTELDGDYAIVATTAFVNEPGTRAMAPILPPVGGGSGGTGGSGGSGDGS